MYNIIDLTGKTIIVTGASSGIGRETSILLSKLGAHIALVARNEAELEKTLSIMESKEHRIYPFDLAEVKSISPLIKQIVTEMGQLSGLAYCAGISKGCPVNLLSYERVHNTMMVNFYPYVEMVRMISKKGYFTSNASIVSISSVASMKGARSQSAYSASKAAMDAFVRVAAKELSEKGIRINTVVPSFIETEMYKKYVEHESNQQTDDNRVTTLQYLGIGKPIDVANSIAFLLSDAAKFITGTQLVVDGGYLS